MIHCFGSKSKNINTKTLWNSLESCKNHIKSYGGEHTNFITRDGLDALVCFNWGIKKKTLVYVDEK